MTARHACWFNNLTDVATKEWIEGKLFRHGGWYLKEKRKRRTHEHEITVHTHPAWTQYTSRELKNNTYTAFAIQTSAFHPAELGLNNKKHWDRGTAMQVKLECLIHDHMNTLCPCRSMIKWIHCLHCTQGRSDPWSNEYTAYTAPRADLSSQCRISLSGYIGLQNVIEANLDTENTSKMNTPRSLSHQVGLHWKNISMEW